MQRRHEARVVLRFMLTRLRGAARYDQIVLMGLAVLVGGIAGYAAVGFRKLIEIVQNGFFSAGDENLATAALDLAWWQILFIPVLGGCLVALILRLTLPDRRVHSVADVIHSAALMNGRIDLRTGLASALASAVSLGTGASAGREGPVVHLGGTLSSLLAHRLHLSPALSRTILGCGVAGAVAASFNAPIAGVFFALEVIIGHYALHAFAPIVIASVVATIVSRIYLGDFPAFIVPDLSVVSALEFPAFAILGIVAALVAIGFMQSVFTTSSYATKLPVPNWALPPFGGLLIGIIALMSPEILGVGYEATDNALRGNYALGFLILLIVAKMAATAITLAFRFGGGVFSPALFLGAMTGASFGLIAAMIFPELASGHGVYAMVGMGAVASAVLGAPISTILIIFELTGDYEVTVAAMIACAVASVITELLARGSFFHIQLARRGLRLDDGLVGHMIAKIPVRTIMSPEFASVDQNADVEQIRALALTDLGIKVLVQDDEGKLTGVITRVDLSAAIADHDEAEDPPLTAETICRRNPMVLYAEDSIVRALKLMEASGERAIPVLESHEERRILGLAYHADVVTAYNVALLESQAEREGAVALHRKQRKP